jgi:hypothetical protein
MPAGAFDSPAKGSGVAASVCMAEIVQFRSRADLLDESLADIDLVTAVDAAIRDLRDILAGWGGEAARRQADECRRMLERALDQAV